VIGALAAGGVLLAAGAAMAVSGGGYSPQQQDCPANADANNAGQPAPTTTTTVAKNKGQEKKQPPPPPPAATPPPNPVPGCHNFQVTVGSANGTRFAEAGIDQLPQGYPSTPGLFGLGVPGSPNFPHSGCAAVNTNGTGGGPGAAGDGCGVNPGGLGGTLVFDLYNPSSTTFTPATGAPDVQGLANAVQAGLYTYLGADDNLDAGEHDGVDGNYGTANSFNGPSDGGAVTTHVSPGEATTAPSGSNPFPVAGASEGFCADNICQEVTTQRQTIYNGGQNGRSRDAANYDTKKWDPEACSSGSPQDEQQCGPGGMDARRAEEAQNVYAEPGAQIYGDPDPQSSPIGPYPLPGEYVGTCGVILTPPPGGSAPPGAPTNSAGQVVIPSGQC
jgi:hypothetical protein